MMRVRAAEPGDGSALAGLLERAGGELTDSAPLDRSTPADCVLVAEDLRNGRAVATARLRSALGLDLPRYAYHVGLSVHAARELRLFRPQRTLYLGNDHTGASELSDIAVDTRGLALADQAAALSLVVQTALLWMAQHRAVFAARLVVALPGVRDGAGQSPFWSGLGRHFYAGDPQAAARLHGHGWKSHVAALMPRQPLYASFLPAAAQAAIAQAHGSAQALREVLEQEGLRYGHHVDIVDGGPILEAATDDLQTVAASRSWDTAPASTALDAEYRTVLNPAPLRAAKLRTSTSNGQLRIAPEDAERLHLMPGQPVRAAPAPG